MVKWAIEQVDVLHGYHTIKFDSYYFYVICSKKVLFLSQNLIYPFNTYLDSDSPAQALFVKLWAISSLKDHMARNMSLKDISAVMMLMIMSQRANTSSLAYTD